MSNEAGYERKLDQDGQGFDVQAIDAEEARLRHVREGDLSTEEFQNSQRGGGQGGQGGQSGQHSGGHGGRPSGDSEGQGFDANAINAEHQHLHHVQQQ